MSEEHLDPAQPVHQDDAARSTPIDRIPIAGRGSSLSDNAARYRSGSGPAIVLGPSLFRHNLASATRARRWGLATKPWRAG